ncbi:rab-like protein 3, partial [Dinothrombium tinctorium]
MAATERIKVLVLGDCGVGKSSFVHLICHSHAISAVNWTIGAVVDVKLHEFNEGTPHQRSFLIELWDIGGYKTHAAARSVFYHSFHGIILVHDLTNRKSLQNLRKWMCEVYSARDNGRDGSGKLSTQLWSNADTCFDTE